MVDEREFYMEGYLQSKIKRQKSKQFQRDGGKPNEFSDMVFLFVFIFVFIVLIFVSLHAHWLKAGHALSSLLPSPPLITYPVLKTLESWRLWHVKDLEFELGSCSHLLNDVFMSGTMLIIFRYMIHITSWIRYYYSQFMKEKTESEKG